MILVDVRSYLHTADHVDYSEIAYGVRGLPKGWPAELIKSNPKSNKPIGGLFDDANTTAGAEYLRNRVHFVVFVREQKYTVREISSRLIPFPNWNFFATPGRFTDTPILMRGFRSDCTFTEWRNITPNGQSRAKVCEEGKTPHLFQAKK